MKKFILHTAIFLMPFIALFTLVETLYTSVPNMYSAKRDYIMHHFDSIDVAVMGPSITLRGVDPKFIDRPCYNVSLNGMDWSMALVVTRFIVQNPNSLEHIILSSNVNNIYHGPREIKGSDKVFFSKYFDLPEIHLFLSREKGLFMLRKIFKYHWLGVTPNLKIDESGFSTQKIKKNIDLTEEGNRLEALLQWNNTRFVPSKQQDLEDLIELCEKFNIGLTLLSPPVHESFRPTDIEEKSEKLNNMLTSYSKVHSHVHFLNWMDHPTFDDDDFNDPIHLNLYGAAKMSELLNDHLKTLNLNAKD